MSCQRERLVRRILLISWQSEDKGSEVQGSEVQGSEVQGSKVQGSKVQGSKVQGSKVQRRTQNSEPGTNQFRWNTDDTDFADFHGFYIILSVSV